MKLKINSRKTCREIGKKCSFKICKTYKSLFYSRSYIILKCNSCNYIKIGKRIKSLH